MTVWTPRTMVRRASAARPPAAPDCVRARPHPAVGGGPVRAPTAVKAAPCRCGRDDHGGTREPMPRAHRDPPLRAHVARVDRRERRTLVSGEPYHRIRLSCGKLCATDACGLHTEAY